MIADRVLERSQAVSILEAPRRLERGSLLEYLLRLFGVPIRRRAEIAEWRPPFGFTDVQIAAPYGQSKAALGGNERSPMRTR